MLAPGDADGADSEASPSLQTGGWTEQGTCTLEEGRPLLPGDLGTCAAKEELPSEGLSRQRLSHPLLEGEVLLWKGGFTLPLADSRML